MRYSARPVSLKLTPKYFNLTDILFVSLHVMNNFKIVCRVIFEGKLGKV